MNISFIVPMRNEEKHIYECIVSISLEMQCDDELIVVDNGSTDNSLAICNRFEKIRLLTLPNKTISAVRNYGAEHAKCELLAFIDADCTIEPGWRVSVIRAMSEKRVDATGSRYQIPANPHIIEKAWYSQKIRNAARVKYINSGNLIIRRTVFSKLGGFNESLVTGEDAELGWRINKNGYVMLEDPSIECTHHGNPKSIRGFYKKQKWHAAGMFGTFRISMFDRPLIMLIAFILSMVMSVILIVRKGSIQAVLLMALWVPIITAGYRGIQYRNFNYFIHLVFLYTIYYLARLHALIDIIKQSLSGYRR